MPEQQEGKRRMTHISQLVWTRAFDVCNVASEIAHSREKRNSAVSRNDSAVLFAGGFHHARLLRSLLGSVASVPIAAALSLPSVAQAQVCGGTSICDGNEVFEADWAGAISGSGSTGWYDNAVLNASAPDAVTNGFQRFFGNSTLNASASGAINGGIQEMMQNSTYNVVASRAVVGGEQRISFDGVANIMATHGVDGGWLRLRDSGTVNLMAANALTSATQIDFYGGVSGGGLLRLLGTSTTVGGISSLSGGAGTITNDGADDSVLSVDSSAGTSNFSGILQNGSGSGRLGLTLLAGELNLSGANTYTGGTTVNSGRLVAGSASGFVNNTDYVVNGGTLDLGGYNLTMSSLSGTGGTVAIDAALLAINQATNTTFAGAFTGTGMLSKTGNGTLALSGDSSEFTGTTRITGGRVLLNAQLGGQVIVSDGAVLDAAAANALNPSQVQLINYGRLNLLADNALSASTSISFDNPIVHQPSGIFALNGHSTVVGHIRDYQSKGLITNGGATNGILTIRSSGNTGFTGIIEDGSGGGKLGLTVESGTILIGGGFVNSYTGGTTVNGGILRANNALGFVNNTDYVVNGGTLDLNNFNLTMSSLSGTGGAVLLGAASLTVDQAGNGSFAGALAGSGSFHKTGAGMLALTGDASIFSGNSRVSGGMLTVNGVLGGNVAARTGGELTGSGHILGDADLTGGGVLGGSSGQTLRVDGNLVMDVSSTTNVALGAPTAAALFNVGGNLTLSGRLNVTDEGGFGAGIYRLFDYGGSLTHNSLAIGTTPAGAGANDLTLQTAVAGQVNLLNTAGAQLGFWDGGNTALHDNGAVDGGSGYWRADGGNWTLSDGELNGHYNPNPTFAVFQGASGIVIVDASVGSIGVTGMQFATDGYILTGDAITLEGVGGQSIIRVGDGTNAGAGMTAIIDSALTGPSMLVKSDLGVLALSGVNNYTGGTRIDAGMLAVDTGASLGDAAGSVVLNGGALGAFDTFDTQRSIVLNTDGRFEVATGKALGLGGTVSGAGDLVKLGDGALALTGANTYGGNTIVEAGTLIGNAASIRGDIGNAATVIFDQGTNASFAGAITGVVGTDGAMIKRGMGELTLTGGSALDWTIEAGGLRADVSRRFGGNAAIHSGAGLTFDQNADAIYAGVLSGSGSFTVSGAGTLVLTGDSSAFGGTTTVGAGSELIIGTTAGGSLGGSMTFGVGSLLGGTGTIGTAVTTVTIAGGAVHAPGNSIGVQYIAGNYVNRGTLRIEATPTAADRIVVAGSVDIAGAALDLVLSPTDASGWNAFNGPLTIIDKQSAGAVVGAFDPVTKNLLFLDTILDYAGGDGNDVTLELIRNDLAFGQVGSTRNQIATSTAIDALGNSNLLWRSVALNSDPDVVRASFDALSGEIHASMKTALIEDSRFVRNAVNDRIRAAFDSVGANGGPVMTYGDGGTQTSAATTDRFAVWGQAFGSWGHTDSDGNAARLGRSTGGFFFGADAPVFDNWRFGAVAGYSNTSVRASARYSSGSSDNYHLGLYGGTQWGDLAFRAGAAYAWHDVSTNRTVAIPGVSDSLKGDYIAGTAQVFGEFGYRMQAGNVALEPFGNLAYVNFHIDGFTEKGGVAALTGASSSTNTTFTTLGIRAATTFDLGGANLTAKGMLGWRHAFNDVTPESMMAFASGGNTFSIAGVPIARNAAVIEAGLDYAITPNASFDVSYNGQFGSGLSDQSIRANFNVKF